MSDIPYAEKAWKVTAELRIAYKILGQVEKNPVGEQVSLDILSWITISTMTKNKNKKLTATLTTVRLRYPNYHSPRRFPESYFTFTCNVYIPPYQQNGATRKNTHVSKFPKKSAIIQNLKQSFQFTLPLYILFIYSFLMVQ